MKNAIKGLVSITLLTQIQACGVIFPDFSAPYDYVYNYDYDYGLSSPSPYDYETSSHVHTPECPPDHFPEAQASASPYPYIYPSATPTPVSVVSISPYYREEYSETYQEYTQEEQDYLEVQEETSAQDEPYRYRRKPAPQARRINLSLELYSGEEGNVSESPSKPKRQPLKRKNKQVEVREGDNSPLFLCREEFSEDQQESQFLCEPLPDSSPSPSHSF